MHPAPIKVTQQGLPDGAVFVRRLESGERIYRTWDGDIYAMTVDTSRWDELTEGDHVQVRLGFPEYPRPVWKSAVVEDAINKGHGFVIVVTYDGVEVAAGPEDIR